MSNRTIRKVGQRVREVLAALAQVGPCSSWHAAKLTPHIAPANVDKYLTRAVGLGLATVDRGSTPKVFAVVPGWAVLVDLREHMPLLRAAAACPKPLPVVVWPQPSPPALPALADLHPLYAVWAKPLLFTH